ncbi:MAG: anti-sigma factor family protein [Isosphaeraceae bacterium]
MMGRSRQLRPHDAFLPDGTNMISPDDESVLSAYIDGELDSSERRAVESAMAADPLLSIKVHDLLAVRDLVADLSRSTGSDLSPLVLERIQGRLADPRPWKTIRQNLPWLATALATAAAIVLVIVATRHQPSRIAPGVRNQVAVQDDSGGQLGPGNHSAAAAPDEVVALSPALNHASRGGRTTSTKGIGNGSFTSGDQIETLDQRRLRSLIDDPRLQRVFLVTDQLGGPADAEKQVASLVERTTRHDYFKITISQGIVIDPLHPDRAVVFAVVLDESELTSFRKGLKDQFQERVQDHEVDPAIALQLADIGQVVSLPAHPEAKITIPDERLAIRAHTDGPTAAQEHSDPVPGLPDSPPGGVQAAETPQPTELLPAHAEQSLHARTATIGPVRSTDGGEDAPNRSFLPHAGMGADDHHLIVLVWVTGPSSG